ncbi:TraR/DksA family transcriptional regulator [Kytococcus sp. Marseille-QA3725]
MTASKKAAAKASTAKKTKADSAGKKAAGSKKAGGAKSGKKSSTKKAAAADEKTTSTKKTTKKSAAKATDGKGAKSAKSGAKGGKKIAGAKASTKTATVGERLAGRKAAKAKTLVVGQTEEPWSKSELTEVRTELESELTRLTRDLELAETELFELVSDSMGSQGDEADAGSFSSERQHEMSLAENSRALLLQTTNALGRIADGTYGRCESCDDAIGKMRLQAFPRATLCMPCKQHQERR